MGARAFKRGGERAPEYRESARETEKSAPVGRQSAREEKERAQTGGESAQENRESAPTDRESVPTDRESAPAAVRTLSRNRSIAPKAHPPHPTRVASAEQKNAGSKAADAEPLGGLASPAEPAARPTRPQTPWVVHSGRTGTSGARKGAGGCAAPHRARPAAPSPCHSPGPGGPLGIIPSRARRGPGEAREPSAAQEGAGDHVPRGRRPATRAARSIPLGGGGRGLQEIQTLRQEIGILTKHSGPAAAPRRGLPPRLTLGPPAHFRAPE